LRDKLLQSLCVIVVLNAFAVIFLKIIHQPEEKKLPNCRASLTQLHTALKMYALEEGKLPSAVTSGEQWADFLVSNGFISDTRQLRCPEDGSLDYDDSESVKSSFRINPEALGKTWEEIAKMNTWLLEEREPFHDGWRIAIHTNGETKAFEEGPKNGR